MGVGGDSSLHSLPSLSTLAACLMVDQYYLEHLELSMAICITLIQQYREGGRERGAGEVWVHEAVYSRGNLKLEFKRDDVRDS